MANKQYESNDAGKENHEDLPQGNTEPSSEPIQRSDTPLVKPIAQTVLDRLNIRVQQETSGLALTPDQKFLEQFGHQLRQWRIQCGYTRQNLADKLNMNLNQLFCLEAGIGLPEDISVSELSALAALLTTKDVDQSLATLIEHYLILLKK